MSKPIAPCKDCDKRAMRCHSACAAYAAFLKDVQEYRQTTFEKKRNENQAEAISVARSDRANKAIRRLKKG